MIQKIEQGHKYLILMPALHNPSGPGVKIIRKMFRRAGAKAEMVWYHGSGSPVVLDVTPPEEEQEIVNLNTLTPLTARPTPLAPGDRVRVSPRDRPAERHFGELISLDEEVAVFRSVDGTLTRISFRYWNIERA